MAAEGNKGKDLQRLGHHFSNISRLEVMLKGLFKCYTMLKPGIGINSVVVLKICESRERERDLETVIRDRINNDLHMCRLVR